MFWGVSTDLKTVQAIIPQALDDWTGSAVFVIINTPLPYTTIALVVQWSHCLFAPPRDQHWPVLTV